MMAVHRVARRLAGWGLHLVGRTPPTGPAVHFRSPVEGCHAG